MTHEMNDATSLLIFDCDGVLIDSEIVACKVVERGLAQFDCPVPLSVITERFTGVNYREMCRILRDDYQLSPPDELEGWIEREVMAAYRGELRAIAGVAELVQSLSMPFCVASSSAPPKLRHGLETTGLLALFEPNIFSASLVAQSKPAPDLFIFAAGRMGVPPARAVVVEDSVAGVRAGVRAGMKVLGFVGGAHCSPRHAGMLEAAGAAAIITRLDQVPQHLPVTAQP